jgi:hypothetical protein
MVNKLLPFLMTGFILLFLSGIASVLLSNFWRDDWA